MLLFSNIVALIFGVVAAKNEEYIGYRVYRIELNSEQQQNLWTTLKSDLIDFWRTPSYKYGRDGLAMVPSSHFNWFEDQLEVVGIERDVYIENVYEYLAAKESKFSRDDTENNVAFNVKAYNRYDNILTYLQGLQDTYSNTNIQVELIEYGVTQQNRPLVYLKITNRDTTVTNNPKNVIVIEAGINPRDWITIPAALNVVEEILADPSYLEEVEWVVIPVVNPDGYEYTHTNLRLWTKSRSLKSHMGAICPGVNLNRNFNLDWAHFDSSSSPCSHVFSGVSPSSEIETNMIEDIIDEYGSRLKVYISLQNNGGFISYPWNYEMAASGVYRQHHLLGIDMIRAVTNGYYNIDVSSTIFDRASGTSVDYARDKGIVYTLNMDIVQADDGVVIDEDDVGEIVDDVWRAIAVAAELVPSINI